MKMVSLVRQRALGTRRRTSTDPGFSDLLEYQAMVGDGVAVLKMKSSSKLGGALLGGFWYRGPDIESSSGADLEHLSQRVNQGLKALDAGCMLHVQAMRVARHMYQLSHFDEAVDQLIEDERCERAQHFCTEYALFVTQAPTLLDRSGVGASLRKVFVGNDGAEALNELEGRIARFELLMENLSESLGNVLSLQRMRQTPDNDELLQALQLVVNGKWKRCPSPRYPLYLDCLLASDLEWSTNEMRQADDYVSVVSLVDLPAASTPAMMGALTTLPFELRWSSRFIVMDYRSAHASLNALRRKWSQKVYPFLSKVFGTSAPADRDAVERTDEVEEALADLESNVIRFGHYTSSIIVRGRSREEADENARRVVAALEGFEARVETQGRLEALLGSFPGHGTENLRKPLINTLNLADLMPLSSEWTGQPTSPCPLYPAGSPALIQATTWGGAPFYLNLHKGQLGHTVIIGQPGSGKSVLIASLATQFLRYPDAQVIALDQGASLLPLTLSRVDGAFYALGMPDSPAVCPLAESDTEEDLGWGEQFLVMLATEQGLQLSSAQRTMLRRALRELAESTRDLADPAQHRTLTHLRPHITDAALRSALAFYEDGPAGRVLNGTSNKFRYARFTVFELEGLLGMDPAILRPTLAFVFRQIEKRLGPPMMLLIDEARRLFGQPQVQTYLETMRRKNCVVVMATQQLGEVARSPIADAIFENCPTKILLPIAKPPESLRLLYKETIGLSDAQVGLLSAVEQQKWYLYFQDGRSRLFTFRMGPVARAFCAASSKNELNTVLELVRTHEANWPPAWLELRGEPDAAQRFRELRLERELAAAAARGAERRQPIRTLAEGP